MSTADLMQLCLPHSKITDRRLLAGSEVSQTLQSTLGASPLMCSMQAPKGIGRQKQHQNGLQPGPQASGSMQHALTHHVQHALAEQLAPAVRIHHSQADLGSPPSKAHALGVLAQLEPLRVGLDALEEPICM